MNKTTVVNIKLGEGKEGDIYIGRNSPWGNPYFNFCIC